MGDDFSARSATFLSWLSNSGASVSSKIEIADLREQNAGRGVVATADIDQDEILFSIPRNIVLSVQNSSFQREHGDLLGPLADDPWLSLILVMIFEHGRASESSWKPYFDVLPSSFDTLIYWSATELEELQASAVVKKIGKKEADEMFEEKIWPIIQSQPTLFGLRQDSSTKDVVMQLAHRMGSLIMAYAFDIESSEAKEADEEGYATEDEDEDLPKGMVPLADILNADADRNNARLFYEPNILVMKSVKMIKKGEEIFNDYGPLPRSDLLRRYGYITVNYTQYDVVEIPMDLVVEAGKAEFGHSDETIKQRLELLEEADALEDGYDISHVTPSELKINMFSSGLKVLGLVLSPTYAPNQNVAKQASRNELPRPWYTLMQSVVKKRQKEYTTTLEYDADYLNHLKEKLEGGMHDQSPTELRRKIAGVEVRMGEKEILSLALAVLEEDASRVDNGFDDRGGKKRGADAVKNGQDAKKRR